MLILDRYILKQFISTLIFSLLALSVLFVIVNLLESLDEFLDQDAGFIILVKYYIHYLPEIIKLVTPIAVLLSTLFTIGRMSSQNEITAMKSGGLSLYRLMIPLVFISILISFGQLYFNGWIVPEAIRTKIDIETVYLKKGSARGPIYNLHFRDSPTRIMTMRYYNSDRKTGTQVAIEEYSSEMHPRLISRTESEKIFWDSVKSEWKLVDGVTRKIHDVNVEAKSFDTIRADVHISHEQIVQLKRSPEEMTFDQLREYISLMKQGGKDVRKLMIEYYGEYAFPYANFIVILFAVPFASIKKKGGIAIQIGAAMVISFFYLLFTKIGQTIGYATDMNAILSAWMANILFFAAGIINIWRTKT